MVQRAVQLEHMLMRFVRAVLLRAPWCCALSRFACAMTSKRERPAEKRDHNCAMRWRHSAPPYPYIGDVVVRICCVTSAGSGRY